MWVQNDKAFLLVKNLKHSECQHPSAVMYVTQSTAQQQHWAYTVRAMGALMHATRDDPWAVGGGRVSQPFSDMHWASWVSQIQGCRQVLTVSGRQWLSATQANQQDKRGHLYAFILFLLQNGFLFYEILTSSKGSKCPFQGRYKSFSVCYWVLLTCCADVSWGQHSEPLLNKQYFE